NSNSAQQTTPPPAAVQASGDRTAATAGDQERSNTRHGRHSRRHTVIGTNGSRNGADDNAAASAPRLYDSYGNRRDQRYSNTRERSYGDVRGDQDDAASWSGPSRDTRRFGRDTRYRSRWQGDDDDRNQAFEPRPRPEPFWGGGFFRRGNGWDD
ncbi:MAG: hypothetical protein J2P55_12360, partial [Rhizobiales bacterium]|nr:hypothetical protein [Hyphomicrobiales bacterium]